MFDMTNFSVEEIHTENAGWIQSGPLGGKQTHYRSALLQLLRKLKPKRCIEWGTHYGESSKVFQKYFNEECPDGKLVTCDIKDYLHDYSGMPNVEYRKVYPHNLSDVKFWHRVEEKDFLPGWETANSLEENMKILLREDEFLYDFAFVDGDHTRISMLNDIKIAEQLTIWPHYMFLDNIRDESHPSVRVFWDEIYPDASYGKYVFENWTSAVDFALIWRV